MKESPMATASETVPIPAVRPPASLELTDEQKQRIQEAAGELVRAAVTGEAGVFPDPTLAGAVNRLLAGVFVSLKRGKHLRGCTGGLLHPPLTPGAALPEAAGPTGPGGPRFPPSSP